MSSNKSRVEKRNAEGCGSRQSAGVCRSHDGMIEADPAVVFRSVASRSVRSTLGKDGPVILAGPWIVDLFSLPGAASED
jgi:hypothetical protein